MRIDGLPGLPNLQQTNQRSDAVRQKKPSVRAADSVEISARAKEAADLSAALRAAPETASPRIAEVRARVRSGYYNSDEVRQQVADALLKSGGMKPAVDDIAQAQAARGKLAALPDVRADRVERAQERVGQGYYDRAEVRRETADRIIDELA